MKNCVNLCMHNHIKVHCKDVHATPIDLAIWRYQHACDVLMLTYHHLLAVKNKQTWEFQNTFHFPVKDTKTLLTVSDYN